MELGWKGTLAEKESSFLLFLALSDRTSSLIIALTGLATQEKGLNPASSNLFQIKRVNLSLKDNRLDLHHPHANLLIIFVFEICLVSVLFLSLSVNRNFHHRLRNHHCQPPEKVPQLLHPTKGEHVDVLMLGREVAL